MNFFHGEGAGQERLGGFECPLFTGFRTKEQWLPKPLIIFTDAEGITTSHVITTLQAAVLLGEYAISLNDTEMLFYVTEKGLRVLPGHEELIALRMKGHSKSGNRSAIKLEWEAYARAVEADAWAGGAPSSHLEELAKSLAQV
jgi:hypothetical protein